MRFACLRDHTAQWTFIGRRNLRVSQVSRVSLLAALLCLIGISHETRADGPVSPPSQAASGVSINLGDDEEEWLKEFMEILRRLYEALGGDPSKLGNSPEMAMNNITIQVQVHGVPTNLSLFETLAVLADIATLTTMLQDPPSSVSPGNFVAVLAEIASQLL